MLQKSLVRSVLTLMLWMITSSLIAQTGMIKGVVKDSKTKETIVGANVIIQGTTIGNSTDMEGLFFLTNLKPGKYTLVVSFISYKQKTIENVKVEDGKTTVLAIELQEEVSSLQGVTITDRKVTGSEISMISEIKKANVISSGISSQQIAKSQDKDASEVLKRMPGVTIIDGRFVVVRGLIERYNSVMINNATTPSSESDVRAFSFDVIPSGMIDRIIINKTPSPELPADFAGAAIQVFTKNIPDQNSFVISYASGLQSGTTFQNFYRYKGGKTDWLGFDDGTRALPDGFPSTSEMGKLNNFTGTPEQIAAQKARLTEIGRSFNKTWTAQSMTAPNDNSLGVSFTHRFNFGNQRNLGIISSLSYSNSYDYDEILKSAYISYDTIKDVNQKSYDFTDNIYSNSVKVNGMLNVSYSFNSFNNIEFRNLINQNGVTKTNLRSGLEYYFSQSGEKIKATDLSYSSRTTYSGQLGGNHIFNKENSKFDWVLGYSYANKLQPDNRRNFYSYYDAGGDITDPNYGKYSLYFPNDANTDLNGRLFKDMNENIKIIGANYSHKLYIGNFHPELKTGIYYEKKKREFNARNIGFTRATSINFNIDLFLPIDEIYTDANINFPNGIKVDEKTNLSDSYKANNELIAGYLSAKFQITPLITLNTGVRVEKNKLALSGHDSKTNLPTNTIYDTLNFFPSANLTYDFNDKSLLRFAYGMTINRPEFREVAPYGYYDFDLKSMVFGNSELKNAYIHNFDIRYEWYPSLDEVIMAGAFYKKFNNPIEASLYPSSGAGGWDYVYINAKQSSSLGIEVDVRKSFSKLDKSPTILRYLKDFTVQMNASLIKSELEAEENYLRDKKRAMQGQSPFIINAGLYYQNDSTGWMVSLLYNVIGKRIAFVGNPTSPHIYEMPFNLLDLTIARKFGKHVQIKGGIKNLLNDKVVFKQVVEFDKDTNGDGKGDGIVSRDQITKTYMPGRYFSLGFTLTL